MIVSIDVGASYTKGIAVEESEIVDFYTFPTTNKKKSAIKMLKRFFQKEQKNKPIDKITIVGNIAKELGPYFKGTPILWVNEIKAMGFGGLILTGRKQGLVVNIGTGTAMIAAQNGGEKIEHVGGTGIGGGTIIGLSRKMLRISDFVTIEEIAQLGDTSKVDLTVAQVVGGPIGIIPEDATASNLGILTTKSRKEDIAAGIFNMVSQIIGVVAVMTAKSYAMEREIILTGGLLKSYPIKQNIARTIELFGGLSLTPKNCEYSTALGAAEYLTNT
jgi:type II pantothenate kinase